MHGRKRLNGFANLTCNVRLIILLAALVGRAAHPIAVPVRLSSLVPDGISFLAMATEDGPWPLGRKVVLHAGASRSSCPLMHQLSLKPALATSLDLFSRPSGRQAGGNLSGASGDGSKYAKLASTGGPQASRHSVRQQMPVPQS